MSRIRGKDTRPELIVRKLLHKAGYRFRLHRTDLPGKPDLVFVSRKKVVFVDGCYWHRHDCPEGQVRAKTNAEFWEAKISRNVERDRDKRAALENAGWQVFVAWECEMKDRAVLLERLTKFLGSR